MTMSSTTNRNDGTTLQLPSDNAILVSRTFAAPARVVFEAITRPEHVRNWWAPRSRGEMTSCSIDLRVGGEWRFAMRANNGAEVEFYGTYREIQAPTRIVQTEIFAPFPDVVSIVTVTLTEHGGRTTFESLSVYPSKEIRDQVIATGMEDGMRESYRQLTKVVEGLA
ncbi:MAG TPA: SRPBCC family protein [Polyangiaceae bacterium]|nr:SRPBCC family protein [Polyangiaceae bacterium]